MGEGIMRRMALGGNLHFLVLINGMSFVRVGVRTERKHIFTWCVVLSASFHNLWWWAGGGEALAQPWVSIVGIVSLRQEGARPFSMSGGLNQSSWDSWVLGLCSNDSRYTLTFIHIKWVPLHICCSPRSPPLRPGSALMSLAKSDMLSIWRSFAHHITSKTSVSFQGCS